MSLYVCVSHRVKGLQLTRALDAAEGSCRAQENLLAVSLETKTACVRTCSACPMLDQGWQVLAGESMIRSIQICVRESEPREGRT